MTIPNLSSLNQCGRFVRRSSNVSPLHPETSASYGTFPQQQKPQQQQELNILEAKNIVTSVKSFASVTSFCSNYRTFLTAKASTAIVSKTKKSMSPPPKTEYLLERRGIVPTFMRNPVKPKIFISKKKQPTSNHKQNAEDHPSSFDLHNFFTTLKDVIPCAHSDKSVAAHNDADLDTFMDKDTILPVSDDAREAPPPPTKPTTKKKSLPLKSAKSSKSAKAAHSHQKRKKHLARVNAEQTQVSLISKKHKG
jgi:hypothetical protein